MVERFAFVTHGILWVVVMAANVGWTQSGILPANGSVDVAKERLIQEVLIPGGVTDERVLAAMRATDRHEFMPSEFQKEAYFDRAVAIGASQTISSPYIVAVMTQELDTHSDQKVLEIGTGSGYQAAVLSPLVSKVYSIEIVPELGEKAAQVLSRLGYSNVFTKVGDGFLGWEEHAPFDRIIVTCSPEEVPQPLIDQLADGGLMVVPVGERYQQMLYLLRKKDGKLEREALRPTLFVPMTGEAEEARRVQANPARPTLVNGDFEDLPLESGHIPGWYYQRGLEWRSDGGVEPSEHYVEFANEVRGRPTNLLQGLAIDGRSVKRIRLSATMKFENVQVGLDRTEMPAVSIRFFNERRDLLGTEFILGSRGTRGWREETRVIRVPSEAREAIVSIGLFGATGKASFDRLKLEAITLETP